MNYCISYDELRKGKKYISHNLTSVTLDVFMFNQRNRILRCMLLISLQLQNGIQSQAK